MVVPLCVPVMAKAGSVSPAPNAVQTPPPMLVIPPERFKLFSHHQARESPADPAATSQYCVEDWRVTAPVELRVTAEGEPT